MKIKYQFATETVEIEVDEAWGTVLVELDRLEYNNDQSETRRHCSLNALNLDETLIPSDEDLERELLAAEDSKQLASAINKLDPRQQYLIQQFYFEGRKQHDLAAEAGVDQSAIAHSIRRAIKRLKKYLK